MKIFAISANNNYTKIYNNYKTPSFRGNPKAFNAEKLLNRLGFRNNDAISVSKDIFETYNNPKRGYHGVKHIINMIKSFDKFIRESNQGFMIKNADEFKFAILMHDYINGEPYDVNKSADKAKEFLHKVSNKYDASYVESLILATDYSKKQNLSFDQQLIQDIDIEILGKSPAEYKQYSDAIRLQYADYDDIIYNPARIKVLESFINRDKIYNTEYYQDKYELQARKNIKCEIDTISK